MKSKLSPWDAENAAKFLASFEPYRNVLRQVEGTLRLDAQKFPHEIRAAAALVIILCRENLWPTKKGIEKLDQIVNLAAHQLTRIKQLFEQRGKIKLELLANPMYRNLLSSLDQEIRILEARLSDPKPPMPKEPPCTWGDFWS